MNQTLQEIEIIVIDGGSTDSTMLILQSLASEDNRIKILECVGSVGAQFNCGLRAATGEYIGICEGDDYILCDKYEKLYKIAKGNECDIVKASYFNFFEMEGNEYFWEIKCSPLESFNKVISADHCKENFLKLGINGFWSAIFSRNFLLENSIFMNETKGAAYQDITFSFLTQLYAKRYYFVDEPLHCYRLDNQDASVYNSSCVDLHLVEYGLLRDTLDKRKLLGQYKDILMAWELTSFNFFCNLLDESIRKEKITRAYEFLNCQIESNMADWSEDYLGVKYLYDALLCGENEFQDAISIQWERDISMFDYFKDLFFKENAIAIFGVGHIGEILYTYAELYNKKIILFDNSPVAQKNGFKGNKVHSAEDVKAYADMTFLVANYRYGNDIKQQLMALGVQESRIILCQNEDYFLRRIFLGVRSW